jgi:hypothetical protein
VVQGELRMRTYTVKIERTTVEHAEIQLVFEDDVDINKIDIAEACYHAEDPQIVKALSHAQWEPGDITYDTIGCGEKK